MNSNQTEGKTLNNQTNKQTDGPAKTREGQLPRPTRQGLQSWGLNLTLHKHKETT